MTRLRHHRDALTLLEVILAVSLMVVLMSAVHVFYTASLMAIQQGQGLSRESRLAQSALDRITRDVQACNGFLEGSGIGLVGEAHSISVVTTRLPDRDLLAERSITDEPLAVQSDVSEVQYYIALDPEETVTTEDGEEQSVVYGLVRREQALLNQAVLLEDEEQGLGPDFEVELWAEEIKYLGFRYYDGVDWVLEWEGAAGNSLPQAVKIAVGFSPATDEELETETEVAESQMFGEDVAIEDAPSDDRYTTVVFLPQADAMMGSRLVRAKQVNRNLRMAE